MSAVASAGGLRRLARAYGARPLDDVPFVAPALPYRDGDDEEAQARLGLLSYELPAGDWRPIPCRGTPAARPCRFVDGSVFMRQCVLFQVGGQRRPGLIACVGAMALDLEGGRLTRAAGSLRLDTVLCLLTNGMPDGDVAALERELAAIGVELVTSRTDEASADFDVLSHRTRNLATRRMESAERAVLLDAPRLPTVVDGLLERRLGGQAQQDAPVVGVVKRQMRHYLPESHLATLYALRPGERTPAFLIETEHATLVSWYLRLSTAEGLPPNGGLVRVAVTREYLAARFPDPADRSAELSAISAWLFELRHREQSYARAAVSLEPIVRLEDELHAVLPPLAREAARLHRAMGL